MGNFCQTILIGQVSSPNNSQITSNLPPKHLSTIDIYLNTIRRNILIDYEGNYSKANVQNVLQLIRQVLQFNINEDKKQLFINLKNQLTNQNELQILEWIENYRIIKYNFVIFPIFNKSIKKQKQHIKICTLVDELLKSKTDNNKQLALLNQIQIGNSIYKIQPRRVKNKSKNYLFKKNINNSFKPTPWLYQKTHDKRYIWRGDSPLDKLDVINLLKFILAKRSQTDIFPSILINAGSHGGKNGQISYQTGNKQFSDSNIVDDTIDTIWQLLMNKNVRKSLKVQLKLSKDFAYTKICINTVSSWVPCIYSQNADHIIDIQCQSAYSKIEASQLTKKNQNNHSSIRQQRDLQFLSYLTPTEAIEDFNEFYATIYDDNDDQKLYPMNIQTIQSFIQISSKIQPQKKLLYNSSIVKNTVDVNNLFNFFDKKIQNIRLLYKASQNEFKLKKYWQKCGKQTNTMIVCLTNKDRIIGAYSPLSHLNTGDEKYKFLSVQWAKDISKTSFIFSLTMNEKFILQKEEIAVCRYKDLSQICFGQGQFKICDQANVIMGCCSNINRPYKGYCNKKYKQISQGGYCDKNLSLMFNGNEQVYFCTIQWQVWKIEFKNGIIDKIVQ